MENKKRRLDTLMKRLSEVKTLQCGTCPLRNGCYITETYKSARARKIIKENLNYCSILSQVTPEIHSYNAGKICMATYAEEILKLCYKQGGLEID